ncbi:class I SAM-dependent methyltransferase [Nocardioides daejeonensis]|uniref:class I SAM-dependent methyltransferase n=1 Tax=Nocardioides daejeonensis TaxID=1046556 RepID=UPI001951133C|nr:class I SAM-dependent methyltransferase [Nocardioides daejeonensis]
MHNDEIRADWADKAPSWVLHERIYDAAFAPFTRSVLDAAGLGRGLRVLDVGCGAGTLLEASVAAGAETVGVDISPEMTDAARRRVPTAKVVTDDAQTGDLLAGAPGAPFDRVISRFGVMFFADPVAAFANLRSITADEGRLVFVCWRAGESDMFWHGLRSLAARLDAPPAPPGDGQPGPMGLADGSRIRQVLTDAGWGDVVIAPLEEDADFSVDGSDGVEERLAVALAGRVGQAVCRELRPRLGEDGWADALDEARAELRDRLVNGTVAFPARAWLATAAKIPA